MAVVDKLKLGTFRRRVVAGSFGEYASLADAIGGLQFIQADPIRSPARAQDLILRQRVAGYAAGDMETIFPELSAEEGYLFAYGFTTPKVWRSLRQRPKLKLNKLELEVLKAVAEMGEAHPRNLAECFGSKSVKNPWGGKSQKTKQILEKLHHQGQLRVCRREKGIRVYAVPEDSEAMTTDNALDCYRHLALTTAHVFGPTTRRFLISELRSQNHLLPGRKDRTLAIDSLVKHGELVEVDVEGITYLWIEESWKSDDVRDRVRILAPFDPLVRDRSRFEHLWDWSYRFEAYVPAAKRQRGYYAMPLLWRDQVIGWANAKAQNGQLNVEFGYIDKRPRAKTFRMCAEDEVEAMARFLGLREGAWKLEHRS